MSAAPVEILSTQPMTMHCANRHQWTEQWPVPCPLADFTARMKAASSCPRCQGKSFLGAFKDTAAAE